MDTAELVIRTYQLSLNYLLEKLKELGFDINTFCDYSSKMLKTLCDARGNDKRVSLELCKALIPTKADAFNSEISGYKAAVATQDKQLDFTKLMTIASA
eukprot:1402568-Ditylum_brightwellii.AAC.1